MVEIDPFNPTSTPVKRTALGRLKHEGAWVQETKRGKIVVYMGDDERNEYIYRYVSNLSWREARKKKINPLDDGILYVAQFNADGTGEWLPLTPADVPPTPDHPTGWSLNDILINTRAAADAVGATMMDRPEWIDTFPQALTAIATLTNNNRRGSTQLSRQQPQRQHYRRVRSSSRGHGQSARHQQLRAHHHLEIRPGLGPSRTSNGKSSPSAGDPDALVPDGSDIDGDKFGSPDGIYVAPSGRLWIQTDVSTSTINTGAYAGFGHNQMLCADPESGEIRRFLVGPKQCEITGVFVTPDERAMFVGIQHPGETADESPNDPGQSEEITAPGPTAPPADVRARPAS